MLKIVLFGLLSVALLQCGAKKMDRSYEYHSFSASNGLELPYRLLKPDNFDPKKAYPVILFLHGSGERGNDNEAQLVHISSFFQSDDFQDNYPAIIIFPQCPKNETWAPVEVVQGKWYIGESSEPTRPMAALLEMMDDFIKKYSVSRNQIYVGGLSMGGFGTLDIIRHRPEMFAAAIPICGGGNKRYVHRYQEIPIWLFHGVKDPVVPVELSREMAEVYEGRGMRYKYTEYPQGEHDVWNKAWNEKELMPWLFGQKRQTQD